MNHIIPICFLLLLPVLSMGQIKNDTIDFINEAGQQKIKIIRYYQEGLIRSISYVNPCEKGIYSKQELFMRGLKPNGRDCTTDSIVFFNEQGKLIEKRHFEGNLMNFFYYEYDQDWNLRHIVRRTSKGVESYLVFEDAAIALYNRYESIEGRVGQEVRHGVVIKSHAKQGRAITVKSQDFFIKTPATKEIAAGAIDTIWIAVKIPGEIQKTSIFLSNEKGEEIELPLEIIGYDLYEKDFGKKDPEIPFFELKNRRKIVIHSDGAAKLLRMYHGEELIGHYPISETRSQINIKGFKKGKYLLEAIDMGKKTKKYCSIELK